MTAGPNAGFSDRTGWYVRTGAYWFAVSFKWFVLFLLQPFQIAEVVPGGQRNSVWGAIVAVGAVEAMIGPAVVGWLSDRTRGPWGRRKPFLFVGALATSGALLLLASARSLPMMAFAYLLVQLSDDLATGPYSSFVPEFVPEEHRGKASGVLGMLQLAAQIVAVGVGLALGDVARVYMVAAVLNLVCAAATLQALPPDRPAPDVRPENKLRLEDWTGPFRNPDFRWTWITRFLVAFGFYLILIYVSNYLSDRVHDLRLFGFDLKEPSRAALVAAVAIAVTGAIGAVAAGKWTDRSRKAVIRASGWVMAATIVPFALVPNLNVMVCCALVFGLGYGAYQTASWAIASDVLPDPDAAAKDMGIWQASVATPQVLHLGLGRLVDAGNRLAGGAGYTLAFLLAAAAFLFGCLRVDRVRGSR